METIFVIADGKELVPFVALLGREGIDEAEGDGLLESAFIAVREVASVAPSAVIFAEWHGGRGMRRIARSKREVEARKERACAESPRPLATLTKRVR